VYKNLSLTALARYKAGPVVLRARELSAGRRIVERLDVKIAGFHQRTVLDAIASCVIGGTSVSEGEAASLAR
jgi:hypothetical protein